MKVYALIFQEDDTYDVGCHEAVIQLFTSLETAEVALSGLIGKPKLYYHVADTWGSRDDLEIREMSIW